MEALAVLGALLFLIYLAFRATAGNRDRGHTAQDETQFRPKPSPPPARPAAPTPDPKPDCPPPPPIPPSRRIEGRAYVIDGDTIRIDRIKIRLAGIDAPELHQPWGQKSKWAMVRICKGQTIRAELTGETSYDRLVGTCYLPDGRDIGAELIKLGLALDWELFTGGKYRHLEPPGVRRKIVFTRRVERPNRV
ncbi:thermonuclease family protein [Sulfitobacter sp. D35]|uniref:thermonuclease family protein n=1 Tax=Sulfitobacter sp. D35 TaxID=3083252 RepID=UPI00296F9499|nr:thermonuclease family protein [Sulfitobacter sp. D35]MDW4500433.1 thermonuclease family protein [Sulfitobacter sp. D35]